MTTSPLPAPSVQPFDPGPQTRFDLPDDLSASAPPESRGLARDEVRLLIADGHRPVRHARFHDLHRYLRPGDPLVVNVSATMAAAVDGVRLCRGGRIEPTVVHVATALDDGRWVVELRAAPDGASPVLDARAGDRVRPPDGSTLTLLEPRAPGPATGATGGSPGTRLWRSAPSTGELKDLLACHGRPIRYGYVDREWPLAAYQTVFATEPAAPRCPVQGALSPPSSSRGSLPAASSSRRSSCTPVCPPWRTTSHPPPNASGCLRRRRHWRTGPDHAAVA